MRGNDRQQGHVFSYLSPEQRVRQDHPLRPIRAMVDQVLKQLSPKFDKMYSKAGRPSIPPEQLLRALLLQMLYTVRSERLLMEQLDYNILFRWFVGLNLDDAVWVPTVFTKNRDRLLEGEVAKEFLARVVQQARAQGWAGDEHFTVDGTLLEAWAGAKSFQPKDTQDKKEKPDAPPPEDPGNPTVDFHGERRSNATHESQSDPDALLARKGQGKEAKLSYCGNLLVENRHGLIVDSRVWEATGTAERHAALDMLQGIPGVGRVTRPTIWCACATCQPLLFRRSKRGSGCLYSAQQRHLRALRSAKNHPADTQKLPNDANQPRNCWRSTILQQPASSKGQERARRSG